MKDWLAALSDVERSLAEQDGIYRTALRHGSMSSGLYVPAGHDPQGPHEQDELYVVVRGRGKFSKSGATRTFGPGDAIFVEAGAEHRFENFTEDFAAWAVFWGPKGGEQEEC